MRLLTMADRWARQTGASPLSDHLRIALTASANGAASDPGEADPGEVMVVTIVASAKSGSTSGAPAREHPAPELGDTEIVAYAIAAPGAAGMICEAGVSPSAANPDQLIAEVVSTTAQAALAEGSPFQGVAEQGFTWWVDNEITHPDWRAKWGLPFAPSVDRTLYEMARTLPTDSNSSPAPASHVKTRSFIVGEDDEAWVDLNNRAFAGHPEQAGWTQELLHQRFAEPWFDADGFRIYDVDGKIAAFCWTKIHRDREPVAGEIYVIAVDPAFHGQGLGRELTLAGLDAIAAQGISTAILYVDAQNQAAVNLYRSLGFEVDRTRTAYRVVRVAD